MELGCRSGAPAKPERSPNGAQDPERSTGLRKDTRGPETTLFRDYRISRHSLETQCLTFNEELANEDLEVVDKLVEVQKDARGNPPAERPRVGALKTPVTRRQMPRVSVRRRRMRAR